MDVESQRRPDLVYDFAESATAPRSVRRAVQQFLDDRDEIAEAVLLVTSELVSNVVLHAGTAGQIKLWDPKPDVPLRIEVSDRNPRPPLERTTCDSDLSGRGLRLVAEFSRDWGVSLTSSGKTIWAEFHRSLQPQLANPPQH